MSKQHTKSTLNIQYCLTRKSLTKIISLITTLNKRLNFSMSFVSFITFIYSLNSSILSRVTFWLDINFSIFFSL